MIWTAQKLVSNEWVDQFHFEAKDHEAAKLHPPYAGFSKLLHWRLQSNTPEGIKAWEFLKRHNYQLT
jgi:hypothetical protein